MLPSHPLFGFGSSTAFLRTTGSLNQSFSTPAHGRHTVTNTPPHTPNLHQCMRMHVRIRTTKHMANHPSTRAIASVCTLTLAHDSSWVNTVNGVGAMQRGTLPCHWPKRPTNCRTRNFCLLPARRPLTAIGTDAHTHTKKTV